MQRQIFYSFLSLHLILSIPAFLFIFLGNRSYHTAWVADGNGIVGNVFHNN